MGLPIPQIITVYYESALALTIERWTVVQFSLISCSTIIHINITSFIHYIITIHALHHITSSSSSSDHVLLCFCDNTNTMV